LTRSIRGFPYCCFFFSRRKPPITRLVPRILQIIVIRIAGNHGKCYCTAGRNSLAPM